VYVGACAKTAVAAPSAFPACRVWGPLVHFAVWPHGGQSQKKECLNLTNKAVMLLKTKTRVYEQSRTKPIVTAEKPCKTEGHSADLKSLCDKRITAILAVIGTAKMPVLRAADRRPNLDGPVVTQTPVRARDRG